MKSDTSQYFWMYPGVSEDCGHEASLLQDSEFFISMPYVEALNYFNGRGGKLENWEYHFNKQPCDLCKTPVSPLVSEKIKNVADNLKISAKYHQVKTLINGKNTSEKYYLVKPLEVLDFVDVKSGETYVLPKSSKYMSGWIDIDLTSTTVSYSTVENLHWVTQRNSVNVPWLISLKFKNLLQKEELKGKIKFYPVKDSGK